MTDRFQPNARMFKLDGMAVAHTSGVFQISWLSYPGDPTPTLTLYSYSSASWLYLRCHSLTFLSDGEATMVETSHDGRVGSGYVSEYIRADIPVATLAKIAAGRSVEGKLCNDEFRFNAEQITNIRAFVARVAR